MNPHHFERLNSLFCKELSQIIHKEKDLPCSIFLSISQVEFDKKMNLIRVKTTVFPQDKEEEIIDWLNKNKKFFRFKLAQRIRDLKRFPEIEFTN